MYALSLYPCLKCKFFFFLFVNDSENEGIRKVKQETPDLSAAVSKEHVTQEDLEIFKQVLELSMQVRRLTLCLNYSRLLPSLHRIILL